MDGDMDLRQLAYFVRIVECGSISKAAQTLHIAQPSLSQRVKDLEAQLGTELLNRTSSGVVPTDVGVLVANHARSILDQVDDLKREVADATGHAEGAVAIGLPVSISAYLTVPLVQGVMREHPDVSLHLAEGFSGHVQEWVLSGRVDFGVLYTADPIPGLDLELLLTEELFLIGSGKAKRAHGDPLSLSDLVHLPLVLPSAQHAMRRNIERMAFDTQAALNVPVEVDSLTQIISLVRVGDLFTILPKSACRSELHSGSLVATRIVRPVLHRPVALATSRDRQLSSAARSISNMTRMLIVNALAPAHAEVA